MILGSNGQNIYPEEIESLLNEFPYVVESLVVMRNGLLHALIYPDREKAKANELSEEGLKELMRERLKQVNLLLPSYSKIADVELRQESFEKTPKQSIKRYLYQEEEN